MLLKIRPTVIITLTVDLRGFVDERGDLRELALRACPAVPEGGRVRVDFGGARFDTRNVVGRIIGDEVIGWRRAAEIELVGTDDEFLKEVADLLEHE